MNYQCYNRHCVSNPVGYCLCGGTPIIFCVLHLVDHIKINRDHRIFDFVGNPLSETHKNVLKISQFKFSLKNLKNSLLSESFKLTKLINNFSQSIQININKQISDCDEMINRVSLQDENKEIINHDSIISKLASDQIQNNLKEWHEKMLKNYSHLQDQIKKTLDISKFKLYENEISFFRNNTKQLISLNLDTLQSQLKDQNSLLENINYYISICELPNNSKFCFGSNTGLTFIIDQDKNVKLLPCGKINRVLDSKYNNKFVYAIGGYAKLAEKYNLLENMWESCASIPYNYNFNGSRSALLGNRIVIVGYHFGKVISYDINQNNYLELSGINLVKDVYKFTFTGGNRLYIGECQKNVYESGENDFKNWTCISSTNPVTNFYQISYYNMINESVYFLNHPANLYEFKLKTKEIKLIKNYK